MKTFISKCLFYCMDEILLNAKLLRKMGHLDYMAVVTPTDRHKSVCNRCVSCFVVFCVVTLLSSFCGCRGFCHRTESENFLILSLVC